MDNDELINIKQQQLINQYKENKTNKKALKILMGVTIGACLGFLLSKETGNKANKVSTKSSLKKNKNDKEINYITIPVVPNDEQTSEKLKDGNKDE